MSFVLSRRTCTRLFRQLSLIKILSNHQVPGIGPATEKKLRENGISTTYGLIGKYLSLKEEGVEPVEHADRFYFWLKSIGTSFTSLFATFNGFSVDFR